jgi:hypothetical protein
LISKLFNIRNLILLIAALAIFVCIACVNNRSDLFVDSIYKQLNDFGAVSGNVSIDVPEGVNGYLVIFAPYAINNSKEISLLKIGKRVKQKMIEKIQGDSAFHVFILNESKIAHHEKLTSFPVVFNTYFSVPLEQNCSVVFSLENKVLTGISMFKTQ